MRNFAIFLAFAITGLLLFNVWGSLNAKLVALESRTGSYLPTPTPAPSMASGNSVLLERIARLERMQAENGAAIASILERISRLPVGSCPNGVCPDRVIAREVVYFDHDSSTLSATEALKIDRLLQAIDGDVFVALSGHADTSGDNRHNHLLSLRRAAAVRNYLSANLDEQGDTRVPMITISAAGEEVTREVTADGVQEALNRAVEIQVYR